ncbi:SDR family NAD(P)-dependent oxidoreductase [Lacisediminihabitans changchengi]|uniref:SDR family NAD(P)-dependent oxidoreductase n=1 Tax=Lacisediminihabitans changchengi TaxID=2787634 RepID=A0A934W325_9MICO|nr:SDR family NAD(P)-dependent oxidoreductase [Lacisediminihabitans changchengi]MBK4347461.1 SDR family NAD(P)-dependent oxidoreductase [Lacisediminihabitans changchengi]
MPDSPQNTQLENTTIVITGASSGIGRAAAIALAEQGATLAVVGRNPERTRIVANQVGGRPFLADFDRLDDVRALAGSLLEAYDEIDVLANNAGGLVAKRGISADGHERTFQHNHLAPFLLTALLGKRLVESNGRVISTASGANMFSSLRFDDLEFAARPYLGGWVPYGTSKLETIMFIRELAKRVPGITAYSFHPGYVATEFGADSALVRLGNFVTRNSLAISPQQGAAPLVHLASTEELDVPNGTYFDGLKPFGRTRKLANDADARARLWDDTARILGLPA